MINQQLLDFIKAQLLRGVDKETITKELSGGGWTEEDINEGFNVVNPPVVNLVTNPIINPTVSASANNPMLTQTTNNSGKKVLLIIIILFIIAGGASGYYFRNDIPVIKDLIKSKDIAPITEISQEKNTQSQIQKEEVVIPQQEQSKEASGIESVKDIDSTNITVGTKSAVITSQKTGPINCGTEIKCFIAASKNCSPAFVEETKVLDIFGIVQKNKMKSTLYGLNPSKKCVYSSYVIDISLSYSPEMKEQAKAAGATDEELRLQLEQSNKTAKSTIGMLTKCSFDTSYLTKLLTKWDNGSFGSSDMDSGNCNITGGTLPPPSRTIYISSTMKETSNAGLKFDYIDVSKDNAKIKVTEVSTGKTSIVSYPLNKEMNIFGQTMTLVEVTEEEYMLNGEIFKYLDAGIEIFDK